MSTGSAPRTLVVAGGGAAGFFCAVNAAGPSLRVILLEKTGKLLSKVLVSGGGRCNVTHGIYEVPSLLTKYPRGKNLLKRTLHGFGPSQTVEWFAARGVSLKTEADGRMFPVTDQSSTIARCLLDEAATRGVDIRLNSEVTDVKCAEGRTGLRVLLKSGESISADFVCVACGGYPKLSQYSWLAVLGHTFQPPVPSLFTLNIPNHPLNSLMGVSVPAAQVRVAGTKLAETGPVLITHWGLSGPAVLRLSAWGARELASRDYRFTVSINWIDTPENLLRERWPSLRALGSQPMAARNPFGLPQRLWEFLLAQSAVTSNTTWATLTAIQQNVLIRFLTAHELSVNGKTTFKEEFVTCGGVTLGEVDPLTMQSRIVPGLYFSGEILDVDGITGGFNFQHAWASGWAAAKAISASAKD